MNPRIGLRLRQHGDTIAVVLLAIAIALAVGAGYVYLNPPVETTPPETVDQQQFAVSITDSTVATNETPLYDQGRELTNQTVYFTDVSDTLHLDGAVTVPSDRRVHVSYRFFIEVTAERNEQVVWRTNRSIASGGEWVTDGDLLLHDRLAIPGVSADLARAESILEPEAPMHMRAVLEANYTTRSTAGELYDGTVRLERPISLSNETYWLTGETTARETEQSTVEGHTYVGDPDVGTIRLLGLGGVLSVVLSGTILWYRRQLPAPERLRHRAERANYDEWISEGTVVYPEQTTFVEMASLEDLVNTAIDASKRVVYDPNQGVYAVYDWPWVYLFRPGSVPTRPVPTDGSPVDRADDTTTGRPSGGAPDGVEDRWRRDQEDDPGEDGSDA